MRLFGEDPRLPSLSNSLQAGPFSDLKLPWTSGSTWYFTAGPHNGGALGTSDNNATWSAIDFAPSGTGCGRDRWIDDWVVSAQQGKVVQVGQVMVIVDHGDGWRTGYFHIPSEGRVSSPSEPQQGQSIGHPGCCGDGTNQYTCSSGQTCSCNTTCSCSGKWNCCSTGAHVHFMLYKSGNKEAWQGKTLSGWTIQSTTEYNGRMTKSGQPDRVASATKSSGNELTSDNRPLSVDLTPPSGASQPQRKARQSQAGPHSYPVGRQTVEVGWHGRVFLPTMMALIANSGTGPSSHRLSTSCGTCATPMCPTVGKSA